MAQFLENGTPTGNATEDICPKGWRMPTGDTSGEYSALANAIYGSIDYTWDATAVINYRNALSLPLSSYLVEGSTPSFFDNGSWWSSTVKYDDSMCNLFITADVIGPEDYYSGMRTNSLPVRCVLGS